MARMVIWLAAATGSVVLPSLIAARGPYAVSLSESSSEQLSRLEGKKVEIEGLARSPYGPGGHDDQLLNKTGYWGEPVGLWVGLSRDERTRTIDINRRIIRARGTLRAGPAAARVSSAPQWVLVVDGIEPYDESRGWSADGSLNSWTWRSYAALLSSPWVFLLLLDARTCYRYLIGRGNRTLARFCIYCGYDLRATPWRCPECGRRS
jgi:hypothetical protein